MTGRDLIIYILANGLENEPVFKDGKIIGYITEEEAAVRMGVGIETVRVWINFNLIEAIQIGNMNYIRADFTPPLFFLNRQTKEVNGSND